MTCIHHTFLRQTNQPKSISKYIKVKTIFIKHLSLFDVFVFNFVLFCKFILNLLLYVSIADGRITILREKKILAETFDAYPFEIGHISFGSFDNAIIQYYYNCKNSVERLKRHNSTDSMKSTEPEMAALMMMKSNANGFPNNIAPLLLILLMLRILLPYFIFNFI